MGTALLHLLSLGFRAFAGSEALLVGLQVSVHHDGPEPRRSLSV